MILRRRAINLGTMLLVQPIYLACAGSRPMDDQFDIAEAEQAVEATASSESGMAVASSGGGGTDFPRRQPFGGVSDDGLTSFMQPPIGAQVVLGANDRADGRAWHDQPAPCSCNNHAPIAHITKPYQHLERVLAGHTLSFAAEAEDAEDGLLNAALGRWTLTRAGASAPTIVMPGAAGSFTFPQQLSTPTTFTLAYTIRDTCDVAATSSKFIEVLPWDQEITLGSSFSGANYETFVAQFTVAPWQVGQYFYLTANAPRPLAGFIVRGDRRGSLVDFDYATEDGQRMALVGNHYLDPQLEFRAPSAGPYTFALVSMTESPRAWEAPLVAPRGMQARFQVRHGWISPAAAVGRKVYYVRESFPQTLSVDDTTYTREDFDFDALERSYNRVFRAYARFVGSDVTKYGTTIGVMYPRDPAYPYCGDAASPLNIACLTLKTRGFFAFEHELAHVFTQAYPYEYSFADAGRTFGNTESLALFLVAWLADPRGGGGSEAPYLRTELQLLNETPFANSQHWHEVLGSGGFPLLLKNVGGGWQVIGNVLKRYAAEWRGQDKPGGDGLTRALTFYGRLVDAIPDEVTRDAFYHQLRRWNYPLNGSTEGYVDVDEDGIVEGLDPDDEDPLTNQYTEECADSRCVVDGLDNNQNGYIDEFILRPEETIELGDDNVAYGADRGTRRKLYLTAASTITVAVESGGKRVWVGAYRGNLPIWEGGAMWWWDRSTDYPVVLESSTVVDPSLTFQAPVTGVYTFVIQGHVDDGVPIGHRITYHSTVL